MDVKTILTDARALVEKGWTQEAGARDAEGNSCYSNSSSAVCFCTLGAISRVIAGSEGTASAAIPAIREALYGALPEGFTGIVEFNDSPGRTQAEVLNLFDTAISNLEKAA